MTQADVKDYVLHPDYGCSLYDEKEKEDGVYYFIRNNTTKKLVVVYPVKSGIYTPASVCHICIQLSVPIPVYAECMQVAVENAKARSKEITQQLKTEYQKSQQKPKE